IDRQCTNAELFARTNDAQRDFPTIGNQNFLKHMDTRCGAPGGRALPRLPQRTRNSTWPNWTGLPFSATTSAMTPLVSALISFITFIASIMQTTVSSVTVFPTSTKGAASGDAARKKVPTIGETISLVDALSVEPGAAAVAAGPLATAGAAVDITSG